MPKKESFLKSLTGGDPVNLKAGALPHVKIRNWVFQEITKDNKILLYYKAKNYTLEVDEDVIDWEEYQKNKEEEAKPDEKRRHRRHSLNLPIEYYLADLKTGHPGFTLNISEDGLAVDLPEKLEEGKTLKLKVFHAAQGSIEIVAKIVWINPPRRKGETYRSGMKIVKLSPENKNRLENLLVTFS